MSRRAGAGAGSAVGGRAGARGAGPAGRGEAGDTLAFLVIWPTLLVAILVLLVHAFIVSNARAEAEVAASAGLRAAWHSAADADFLLDQDDSKKLYVGEAPHPAVRRMSEDVKDAVARVAAEEDGWRWWTPGIAEVYSDWCADPGTGDRPSGPADPGWVRVVVSGDVFGPVAALWPDRLARVHAVATGPAVISVSPQQIDRFDASGVPVELARC